MKTNSSQFKTRFLAYRRAALSAVAVASVSTVRTSQHLDDKDANRRMMDAVRSHTTLAETVESFNFAREESVSVGGFASYVLTPDQRSSLGSRPSVIFRRAPVVIADELLPAGFVPAQVEEYVPLLLTGEADLLARAQAQFELDAEAMPARLMSGTLILMLTA